MLRLKRLTPRRKKFVDNIVLNNLKEEEKDTITECAKKAGFSKKTAYSIGSELLKKPEIQAAIDEKAKTVAEKLGITPEYILGNFKRVSEVHSKTVTKTLGNGENVYAVEEMIDCNAVIKANELLGKHLSLFVEKVEVTGKDGKDLIPEEKRKDLARKLAFIFNAAK
jgi:phage terminase small subunit